MVIQRSNTGRRPRPVVPTNVAPVIGGIAPQRPQPGGIQPTAPQYRNPHWASPTLPQRNPNALGATGPGRIMEPSRGAVAANTPLPPAYRGAGALTPPPASPFNGARGMAPPGAVPAYPVNGAWRTPQQTYNMDRPGLAPHTARDAWYGEHLQGPSDGVSSGTVGIWSHGSRGVQEQPVMTPIPQAAPMATPYMPPTYGLAAEGQMGERPAGFFNDLGANFTPPPPLRSPTGVGALRRFEDAWRDAAGPFAGSAGQPAQRTVSAPVRERGGAGTSGSGLRVAEGPSGSSTDASTDARVQGASPNQTNVPLGQSMAPSNEGSSFEDTGKEVNGLPVYRDEYGQDWTLEGNWGDSNARLTRVDSRRGYDPMTGDPYVGWDVYGSGEPPREGERFTNPDNKINWTFLNGQWHQTNQLPADQQKSEFDRWRDEWVKRRTEQIAAERARVEGGYKAEQLDPALLERVLQAQRARNAQATARASQLAMYRGGSDPSTAAASVGQLYQNEVMGGAAAEAQARFQHEAQNLQLRVQMNNQKLAALMALAQQDIQTTDTAWAAGEAERIRQENEALQIQLARMGAEAQAAQSDASMWSSIATAGGSILGGLLGIFGGPAGVAAGAAIGGSVGAAGGAVGSNFASQSMDWSRQQMAQQYADNPTYSLAVARRAAEMGPPRPF